jgi:surface protein
MLAMFVVALSFNQPIPWDTSNVEEMSLMFFFAEAFNQDITSWDVGSVEQMVGMFQESEVFNQDLSGWNVAAVTDCEDFALDANPAWTVDLWPNFVSCSP